ncbi:ABC transporter ATP-binding protein [Caproiciproducens sp. CPB-2]|uniref:ABC transporter ATP-binding protein n=1 Tax=Caproiciproducens sp. CPB-2 TaxID=3030017 RepID=UPI0023DA1EBA|nr:ABC transporter ATP-binding protein [Caproiciproducens sp. CPB-2]MDF1496035.1 ABC transporter ATP-binding protein [Caproiciproducens sp. CPB-2]
MDNILKVSNLCKDYPSFHLQNVSFTVPSGSIVGFVGENGAGKTTTIKLILNEMKRDGGSVQIFGLDNRKDEQKIKEQIGVVFDESYFHGEFKAGDIASILRSVFQTWDDDLFGRYLSQFKLPKNKMIKEYSKGMKMKLSIASALAHRPRLLILDEATSGLDPVVRSEILDIFLDFIQDESHAVLFSSHITGDLEKVADYVVFIHEGKIIFDRSKDDLIYQYGIVKCGPKDFQRIDPDDLVRWRKTDFGYEALVTDRDATRRKYSGLVVDPATIDDIMLIYVKGGRS